MLPPLHISQQIFYSLYQHAGSMEKVKGDIKHEMALGSYEPTSLPG